MTTVTLEVDTGTTDAVEMTPLMNDLAPNELLRLKVQCPTVGTPGFHGSCKQLHQNIASTDESDKDKKVKTKSSSKNKTRFKPTGTQKIQPIPSHFKSLQDSHESLGYGNDLPLAEHLVFL